MMLLLRHTHHHHVVSLRTSSGLSRRFDKDTGNTAYFYPHTEVSETKLLSMLPLKAYQAQPHATNAKLARLVDHRCLGFHGHWQVLPGS